MRKYMGISVLTTLIQLFAISEACYAKDVNYQLIARADGGYALEIDVSKIILFSADGVFQKVRSHYSITLLGKGKDWSYKNQKGYYYEAKYPEFISDKSHWDIGYVWVDDVRRCVYLNLYWISAPDALDPSDINGKYCLTDEPIKGDSAQ